MKRVLAAALVVALGLGQVQAAKTQEDKSYAQSAKDFAGKHWGKGSLVLAAGAVTTLGVLAAKEFSKANDLEEADTREVGTTDVEDARQTGTILAGAAGGVTLATVIAALVYYYRGDSSLNTSAIKAFTEGKDVNSSVVKALDANGGFEKVSGNAELKKHITEVVNLWKARKTAEEASEAATKAAEGKEGESKEAKAAKTAKEAFDKANTKLVEAIAKKLEEAKKKANKKEDSAKTPANSADAPSEEGEADAAGSTDGEQPKPKTATVTAGGDEAPKATTAQADSDKS